MTGLQEGLASEEMPHLFRAADAAAVRQQRRHLRGSLSQLLLVVGAAGAAKLAFDGGTDWWQVLAAACFLCAAVVKGYLLSTKPEEGWYAARAIAESAKSLAWRYAVGGDPFRVDTMSEREADATFVERLREIVQPIRGRAPIPPLQEEASEITDRMRSIRASSLDLRRETFREGRVHDQVRWYATRSAKDQSKADAWGWAQLCLELLGALFALLTATGVVAFNVTSFTAALISAIVAWTQTKRFRTDAAAYGVAWAELSALETLARHPDTEEEWAAYVEQVEQAISREHTIWRGTPPR